MAETVIMPKLGFDMAEGTLVRWVANEGDVIAKGQVLAEIETDKATVEVESGFEGSLLQHLVNQGDIVPVNTPIALIGQPGEKIEESTQPVKAPKVSAEVVEEKKEDEFSARMTEGSGIEAGGKLPGGVRASPIARRIALEKGFDLRQISGSGPGGRIIKDDVLSFKQTESAVQSVTPKELESAGQAETPKTKEPQIAHLLTYPSVAREDEIVPINRLRAAIGRRMVESKSPVPHFYVTHEYNMNAVMSLRKQMNELLPEDEKLSVNDFIIKAVALTLRQFPNLNAKLKDDKIVRFGAVHIGVAVAVEGGLLTIVCKDADQKPLHQIGMEIKAMAKRVREGKVKPEDIEGSTFSISNLGMFEVESFVAIINPPEAAILAIGSAREVPVVENGEIKPGWRMKATISVDHRISDGAEAAQFLQGLARFLERPLHLLI